MSSTTKVPEKGNLTLKCSCGNEDLIKEEITGGIQLILPVSDKKDMLKLSCTACKTSMELIYTDIEYKEHVEEEKVQEAEVIEESKEVAKDEESKSSIQEESKEE